jgi:tRNA nucleotidyltransferase (CCA-adding enzyme)
LAEFSDETLVLLLARQVAISHKVLLSRLKRYLVSYVKSRTVKTSLTGRDLQAMGLKPGPQYKTILGKLLDARIDGVITTEAEERTFVQPRLGLVVRET